MHYFDGCYLLLLIIWPVLANDEGSLAQQSQNPVGDIISVPFRYNLNFNVGPKDAKAHG